MIKPTAATSESRRLPYSGRRWLLGVALPALITAGALWQVLAWRHRLPQEVALHWGPQGVNRTGSVGELIGVMGAMAAISFLILALFSVLTGKTSFIRRLVLGLAVGMAVLMSGTILVPVAVQLDLSPGQAPGSIDTGLLVTAGIAVAGGAIASALAGADHPLPATGPVTGKQADLAPGERAVWVKHIGPNPRLKTWGLVGVIAYLGFISAISWVAQSWFSLIISVVPVLLVLVMLVWTVRVDAAGLTARSLVGWPRIHVPADEIESADVREHINPMGEFGGWGIRSGLDRHGGTIGVVIRAGEGIEISRSGNRTVMVTVDDAATGAALLNSQAARARQ